MFDSDKIAREKPGPGSEAERVTEGQGFQRFQLRLSGFKLIRRRGIFRRARLVTKNRQMDNRSSVPNPP